MKRLLLWLLLTVAGGAGLIPTSAFAQSPAGEVLRLDLDGTVDPLAARYVERGLAEAAVRGSRAVIIRIDTPGGLDSSMRQVIKAIHASPVPVACWVGPGGARAASAGALIMLGCPHASMAPGTNIGAAHPVGFRGEILSEKITNDAAAYARALAQERGRDADVAEAMVRTSESLSADDALARGVISAVLADLRAVQEAVATLADDGAIASASLVSFEMSFLESLLHSVVDPNLAFLLLVLGLGGIVFEILHPGVQVGGVFGGLALIVALLILGMLPVNLAGIALIVLGIVLFVLEAYIPGGVAGIAGLGALLAGGMLLFDSSVPNAQVSKALIVGTGLAMAAFFLVVVRAVVRSQRQKVSSATTEDLVGEVGVVERDLEPGGIVRARNESWTARTTSAPLVAGTPVRVVAVDGLTLEVEPVAAPAAAEAGERGI